MAAALEPAAGALLAEAAARADRIHAAAVADARARLERARADAGRILEQARADGARAAAQAEDTLLSGSRRRAGEAALAARRRAYEALREAATHELVRRASGPGGSPLVARLEELVVGRLGPGARLRRRGPAPLTALAELDGRTALLGPAQLVDQALEAMGPAIGALWS